jgi:hypothetical protein
MSLERAAAYAKPFGYLVNREQLGSWLLAHPHDFQI